MLHWFWACRAILKGLWPGEPRSHNDRATAKSSLGFQPVFCHPERKTWRNLEVVARLATASSRPLLWIKTNCTKNRIIRS